MEVDYLPREKVFRDPVHNYIHVQQRVILDLINTPEFQRLRRIKQLGTTSLTFHGAEHSRFGHCLGVYEILLPRTILLKNPVTVAGMIMSVWLCCVLLCCTISVMALTPILLNIFFIPIMKPGPKKLSPVPKLKLIKFYNRSVLTFRNKWPVLLLKLIPTNK